MITANSSVHTWIYTVHLSGHCTLENEHCMLRTVLYTTYTALHCTQCTLLNEPIKWDSALVISCLNSEQCTICTTHYTLFIAHCTIHATHCIVHSTWSESFKNWCMTQGGMRSRMEAPSPWETLHCSVHLAVLNCTLPGESRILMNEDCWDLKSWIITSAVCSGPNAVERSSYCNKDHQRMMVDPMLMIVQSLRSFLTAVTTTAVAPIAVIFTFIYLNIPKFTWIYL